VDLGRVPISTRGASLTRRVRFHATHRYYKPEWDAAKNRAVFGACAAPEPHDHHYSCDVTIAGPIDSATGMVFDLGRLDEILALRVVNVLDGKLVNDAMPDFAPGKLIPTCEELARVIAERVDADLVSARSTARVASVRIAEDDTLSATWTAAG
jgi:6-pyruvoyltetrahydropterin/6-carboxytetrahydropterin synthase